VSQIRDALTRFAAWSREHPRARCPDAAALGLAAADPWGHPLRITCTDQPADQIAGAVSLGPDGAPGTRDDIASWTLGPDVTDLVRGPRWGQRSRAVDGRRPTATPPATTIPAAAPLAPAAPPPISPDPRPAAATPRPASTGAGSNDTDGDGIPDRR
jgi:hypothetical protein